MAEGMVGNFCQVQGAGESELVKGFDIFEAFLKSQAFSVDPAMNHAEENKGVIGAGGVAERQGGGLGHAETFPSSHPDSRFFTPH